MISSSNRVAVAAIVVLASFFLAVQAQTQAAPTAPVVPVHNPAAPVAPVHGEPKAPVHAPVPVPIWNPNTPLPKMKNTSMIPFALVVALIGGAAVITLGAGIFTFFWHDLRRSKSAYSPTAINDDAVTPAMVEGYGEEGYNENTSLLDH